jgi:hypothetical protein
MNMDRILLERVACKTLNERKFRNGLFKFMTPKMMRDAGLQSLLHRSRLLRQGEIKSDFLALRNDILSQRYEASHIKRADRINQIKLIKKLKNAKANA